jgi:hypothetical protein
LRYPDPKQIRLDQSNSEPVRSLRLIGGCSFLSPFLKDARECLGNKSYDCCAACELNQFAGQTKFKWHFADEVTGFVETFGWDGGEIDKANYSRPHYKDVALGEERLPRRRDEARDEDAET